MVKMKKNSNIEKLLKWKYLNDRESLSLPNPLILAIKENSGGNPIFYIKIVNKNIWASLILNGKYKIIMWKFIIHLRDQNSFRTPLYFP